MPSQAPPPATRIAWRGRQDSLPPEHTVGSQMILRACALPILHDRLPAAPLGMRRVRVRVALNTADVENQPVLAMRHQFSAYHSSSAPFFISAFRAKLSPLNQASAISYTFL